MATTVTVKGQVTLPKAVRDAAGIKPGDGSRRVFSRASGSSSSGLWWRRKSKISTPSAGGLLAPTLQGHDRRRIDEVDARRGLILVDTNILVDIAGPPTQWSETSREALESVFHQGPLIVNSSIFAEFSLGFELAVACEAAIESLGLAYREIPPASELFLAPRNTPFPGYRQRGEPEARPCPIFSVGGHASALGAPILTRDTARYRTYFPEVQLLNSK